MIRYLSTTISLILCCGTQLKFEVKIRATAKKKSEVKTFEVRTCGLLLEMPLLALARSLLLLVQVWVERNKALYVKPHLAITRLWQQQGAKRVELPPPPPEYVCQCALMLACH